MEEAASKQVDILFVGGGLANLLVAKRLLDLHPQISFLILEKNEIAGNHTWSFQFSDLLIPSVAQKNLEERSAEWILPLVDKKWDHYSVFFPNYSQQFDSIYCSIRSDRLASKLRKEFGERLVEGVEVKRVDHGSVLLNDGRKFYSNCILDGRGPQENCNSQVGFQKFFGMDVQLKKPHGLSAPILMDVRREQIDGFQFFYVLPWDERSLLIEDTCYSVSPSLKIEAMQREIENYALKQNWEIASIGRTEVGALPIPIKISNVSSECAIPVGMRGNYFHFTTGYSFPDAARIASGVSSLPLRSGDSDRNSILLRSYFKEYWKKYSFQRFFFLILNRMMFGAVQSSQRYQVFEKFYQLPPDLIQRFYSQNLVWKDVFQIFSGKPPVALHRAFLSLFQFGALERKPSGT